MKKYYAQNGEDFLLWSLFSEGEKGCFVDVGAFDGIHLSNSYSFELEGWKGICVDAHPEYFPVLKKNRPASANVFAACTRSDLEGVIDFMTEPLGLLSGVKAYKTDDMELRYASRGMRFPGFSTVKVPSKSLNSILAASSAPRSISFLSIDTEGSELDVLRGIDFSHYSFRAIVTECNDPADLEDQVNYLMKNGYMLARSINKNHFFVQNDTDMATLQRCHIRCAIEDTEHPLGGNSTHPGFRGRNVEFLPVL